MWWADVLGMGLGLLSVAGAYIVLSSASRLGEGLTDNGSGFGGWE